ncbi:aquaporin-like protein [Annulohypoxylon maeteangense]|uniref:aquaporin-like protein n=1 Tax=Annulohypoxylon maeteangense TaxID=1927788 RepID=UPI002007B850|nr:aquaporin-like protein [Annulohypoxylon maeteangense]KAI0882145.1 aquaporin-like protein [Annulohypoxylon maeteangense]
MASSIDNMDSTTVVPTVDRGTQTEDFWDAADSKTTAPTAGSRSQAPRLAEVIKSHISKKMEPDKKVWRRVYIPVDVLEKTKQPWIEEGYLEQNPSYGQPSKKPIWSVSRGLPRIVRWEKQADGSTKPVPKSAEDLAERGQCNLTNTSLSQLKKQENLGADTRDGAGQLRKRTSDTEKTNSESLGPRDRDEAGQGEKPLEKRQNWWARLRAKHSEPFAEFLATLIAVFMGLAANLSVNLSANQATQYGTYETSCWAWGLAWSFGVYLAGGISGAHMNPVISVCFSIFRGFPLKQCFVYVLAQFIASMVAGALVFGIYHNGIQHVDSTMTDTAMTFFSTRQPWIPLGTAFLNQVVGGAIMMILVLALCGESTDSPGEDDAAALAFGLLLTVLKFALGFNAGSALNPASDFSNRMVLWGVGYRGPETFGGAGWWVLGPWLATMLGSIIGCTIYDGLIFVGPESPINRHHQCNLKREAQRLFKSGKKN